MRVTRLVLLGGILGFAGASSPALAGCDGAPWQCFWPAHHAIYHMENHIAFLQADPYADDGYKGPIIDHLHRKILRIRAKVGMRWPHWPTPCCYSRRPIYIR
jgi:hypothetical protein